jgi:hypothetical protein
MDNAKHFKNKELCFYFYDFYENFFKRKFEISWNFFVEGHGKSLCDARFSLISRFIKNFIIQKNKKIEKQKISFLQFILWIQIFSKIQNKLF